MPARLVDCLNGIQTYPSLAYGIMGIAPRRALVHLQFPKTAHDTGIDVADIITSKIGRILGHLDLHVVECKDCRPALLQLLFELGDHIGNGHGATIFLGQDGGIDLCLQNVNILVHLKGKKKVYNHHMQNSMTIEMNSQ